jgi:hypothetical protein
MDVKQGLLHLEKSYLDGVWKRGVEKRRGRKE